MALPSRDVVVRVPAAGVRTGAGAYEGVGSARIVYIAAAARVADALTQNALLTPIKSAVIPLLRHVAFDAPLCLRLERTTARAETRKTFSTSTALMAARF